MNAIGIRPINRGDTAGFPFDRYGPAASSPWETATFFSGTPPLATAMGGPLRKVVTGWGRRVAGGSTLAGTAMGRGNVSEAWSGLSLRGPPSSICCLANPKKEFLPESLADLVFPGALAGSPCIWESQSPLLYLSPVLTK